MAGPFRVGWGADPQEYFDITVPDSQRPSTGYPLVMWVAGGGLQDLVQPPGDFLPFLINQEGCMVVAVSYQVRVGAVPALQDTATTANLVYDHAAQWGANPDRIVWVGH